jgi:hypothetical protein
LKWKKNTTGRIRNIEEEKGKRRRRGRRITWANGPWIWVGLSEQLCAINLPFPGPPPPSSTFHIPPVRLAINFASSSSPLIAPLWIHILFHPLSPSPLRHIFSYLRAFMLFPFIPNMNYEWKEKENYILY